MSKPPMDFLLRAHVGRITNIVGSSRYGDIINLIVRIE